MKHDTTSPSESSLSQRVANVSGAEFKRAMNENRLKGVSTRLISGRALQVEFIGRIEMA
jgi:hypothetical protein